MRILHRADHSSGARVDRAGKYEELPFLKQVDFINNLSEILLESFTAFLDGQALLEFKGYLLGFL